MIKKFTRFSHSLKDYQKFNDIVPGHQVRDTSHIKDTEIERYINEGSVFSYN